MKKNMVVVCALAAMAFLTAGCPQPPVPTGPTGTPVPVVEPGGQGGGQATEKVKLTVSGNIFDDPDADGADKSLSSATVAAIKERMRHEVMRLELQGLVAGESVAIPLSPDGSFASSLAAAPGEYVLGMFGLRVDGRVLFSDSKPVTILPGAPNEVFFLLKAVNYHFQFQIQGVPGQYYPPLEAQKGGGTYPAVAAVWMNYNGLSYPGHAVVYPTEMVTVMVDIDLPLDFNGGTLCVQDQLGEVHSCWLSFDWFVMKKANSYMAFFWPTTLEVSGSIEDPRAASIDFFRETNASGLWVKIDPGNQNLKELFGKNPTQYFLSITGGVIGYEISWAAPCAWPMYVLLADPVEIVQLGFVGGSNRYNVDPQMWIGTCEGRLLEDTEGGWTPYPHYIKVNGKTLDSSASIIDAIAWAIDPYNRIELGYGEYGPGMTVVVPTDRGFTFSGQGAGHTTISNGNPNQSVLSTSPIVGIPIETDKGGGWGLRLENLGLSSSGSSVDPLASAALNCQGVVFAGSNLLIMSSASVAAAFNASSAMFRHCTFLGIGKEKCDGIRSSNGKIAVYISIFRDFNVALGGTDTQAFSVNCIWNCRYFPNPEGTIYTDPLLGQDYLPVPESPCFQAAYDGLNIGLDDQLIPWSYEIY